MNATAEAPSSSKGGSGEGGSGHNGNGAVSAGSAAGTTNGTVIYSNPELYEAAFSYRDFKQEARFIHQAYKKHAGSSPGGGSGAPGLRSVLDLGCGPATHALLLAASFQGLALVGLEHNATMLDYARKKLQAALASNSLAQGSSVTLVQGDMREQLPPPPPPSASPAATTSSPSTSSSSAGSQSKGFGSSPKAASPSPASSPSPSQPAEGYDMVMCLLGTFCHMLTNKDAGRALGAAARALRSGGLLLLELPHPGDLFDGTLLVGDGGREIWEVPMGGAGRPEDSAAGTKLMVEWGAEFDNFDPVTQVLDRTVSISVLKGEEVVQGLEEVVPARQFTVQELELLADNVGLEVVTIYGDMAQGVGLSHEEAYRMVMVLRKP